MEFDITELLTLCQTASFEGCDLTSRTNEEVRALMRNFRLNHRRGTIAPIDGPNRTKGNKTQERNAQRKCPPILNPSGTFT
eukprot:5314753-Amphidinium_carterae.1